VIAVRDVHAIERASLTGGELAGDLKVVECVVGHEVLGDAVRVVTKEDDDEAHRGREGDRERRGLPRAGDGSGQAGVAVHRIPIPGA